MIRKISAAAVLAVVATLGLTSPAAADEVEPQPTDLVFVGFDAEVAAANGYDIRVIDGYEWSVPATNVGDDTTGGVRGFAVDGAARGPGQVVGSCGFSFIAFTSATSLTTSYTIYASKGTPVQHWWNVEVYFNSGSVYPYNMSGFPSLTSQTWTGTRSWAGLHPSWGTATSAKVASGSVLTSTGSWCTAGQPVATP